MQILAYRYVNYIMIKYYINYIYYDEIKLYSSKLYGLVETEIC